MLAAQNKIFSVSQSATHVSKELVYFVLFSFVFLIENEITDMIKILNMFNYLHICFRVNYGSTIIPTVGQIF